MKFAVISPTSGLERYSTLSNVHLVLAHMWKDEQYANFYRKRSREYGDFTILDNGAYENGRPLSLDLLLPIIYDLRPNVVGLPDYLLQPSHLTVSASLRTLDDLVGRNIPALEFMFIPQAPAGELLGVLSSIDVVMRDPRVGQFVKWIGLPRALHTHFGGMRVWVAAQIKAAYPQLKLHALGSGAGSIGEFEALSDWCESMDSSSPVWRGWNGYNLLDKNWPDVPVDFKATLPGDTMHKLILSNLKFFEVGNDIEGSEAGTAAGT